MNDRFMWAVIVCRGHSQGLQEISMAPSSSSPAPTSGKTHVKTSVIQTRRVTVLEPGLGNTRSLHYESTAGKYWD